MFCGKDWPKDVRFSPHRTNAINLFEFPAVIPLVLGLNTHKAPRSSGKGKPNGPNSKGGGRRQSNWSKNSTGGKAMNDNPVSLQETSTLVGTMAGANEQGE